MCKEIGKCLLAWFATILLKVIGWKSTIHRETMITLNEADTDLVLLFQHTTYFDLFFGCLFCWAEGIGDRVFFVMSELIADRYWYAKWLFSAVGCVYVPCIETTTPQGTVQELAERFQSLPTKNKIILVAPTGTTHGNPETRWRSGWYYLAQKLGAKIGTIGVNFHPLIRTVHLGQFDFIDPNVVTLQDCIASAKKSIGNIYGRWPKHSCAPVRTPLQMIPSLVDQPIYGKIMYHHTPKESVTVVDTVVLTSYAFILPWLATIHAGMLDLTLAGFCAMICSIMYHSSYEQNPFWHTLDKQTTTFAAFYFILHILVTQTMSKWFIWLLGLTSALQIYFYATPRKEFNRGLYRPIRYELYHSLFHIVLAMVIFSYCCK